MRHNQRGCDIRCFAVINRGATVLGVSVSPSQGLRYELFMCHNLRGYDMRCIAVTMIGDAI